MPRAVGLDRGPAQPPPARGRAWIALLSLLLWLAPAWAQTGQPVLLAQSTPSQRVDPLARAWLDPGGDASLEQAMAHAAAFEPVRPDTVHPLDPRSALWLHLRLLRAEGNRQQWLLVLPNPLIDEVRIWQRNEAGRWWSQAAGDRLAVERWAEPGRYPAFRLDLPGGQPHDLYVQVRSAIPTGVPLRLSSDAAHSQRQQLEYLGLGAAFGALLLLLTACLAQGWAYRDPAYGWYALYAGLSTLGVMAYTGAAAHLLWPGATAWADAAPGGLAALATGAAILFVRDLTAVPARHPLLDRVATACAWSGLPLALAYLLLPRAQALDALAAYLALATVLNTGMAALAWLRRDVVGLWVLCAYVPLAASVIAAVMRLLGWLPTSFLTQYAVVLAILFEVPMLLVALSVRSRDRHGAQIREQALASQDALTGLLASHLFHDRLRQVVTRFKRDRESAAVVFIDLVNYPRIKGHFGQPVAEQSLLRSVIKLRRLVRDVDTLSRIGEARFGLIMEGVGARAAVTDRAARLIAAGLMPLPGLKPDVTLHFHIAAVLLSERPVEAVEAAGELDGLLASMSPRTRRPIRFLQPAAAGAAGPDGVGPGADSELPEAAVT
ncbi:7TM diverse intracellular signaling domain-containing protein [Ramlibacter tataouinensis]|uniref:sensor domain-containing diguanylate cyclase n=1 Tax=Ramlibacter tataouinensis TaxID=94132 RepID=UPI0022F3A84A|nr:7TM diverse intracellular signaling domain-containing protein [Ramlibacter tataouinensis]WBY03721.1 7TM diverse intracellular signaling domain-containing protein [Ramlibacter tataouinensis]